MTPVLVLIAGVVTAGIVSEYVLRGGRIQTRLLQVLGVHAVIGLAALLYLVLVCGTYLIPPAIFWAGAFLTWFGVRSHIESSILLRMAYLLREGPMGESGLLARYESHYGGSRRLDELLRARLVEQTSTGMALTAKGAMIHRITSWLR